MDLYRLHERSRLDRLIALPLALVLLLAACSSGKSVGSEEILEFEEQEESRLGAGEPSPESASPADPSPTEGGPAPTSTQAPPDQAPAPTFFDVVMIPNHPYYEPGDEIVISRGSTLRVTNRDNTPERPERSFTAADGSFDSGMLKFGQVWTLRFDSPGSWRIVDGAAPFIFGRLEVR